MINRFGTEVKRGDLVSFHTARGDIRAGFVRKFSRMSVYGWRAETSAGSCGIDDVIRVTRVFIRPGCRIEVGTGKPGYRWVQGWEVLNPESGGWSAPVRRLEALAIVRHMKG